MSHEVTKEWEIDGKYHVIPSKGKNKGKSIAVFDTMAEANAYSKARSIIHPYVKKAKDILKIKKKKK